MTASGLSSHNEAGRLGARGGPLASLHDALAHAVAELALYLTPNLAVAYLASAISAFLAARKCQLDLRARALEVDAQGHESQPFLRRRAYQPLDLVGMQEQLSRPIR